MVFDYDSCLGCGSPVQSCELLSKAITHLAVPKASDADLVADTIM